MDFILGFWLAALVLLSLLPFPSQSVPEQSDKVFHFIAYFITAALLYMKFKERRKGALITSVLLAFGLGDLLEILQSAVPGRTTSLWDLAANSAGCFAFYIAARLPEKKQINEED